jgi:hypothetical protein
MDGTSWPRAKLPAAPPFHLPPDQEILPRQLDRHHRFSHCFDLWADALDHGGLTTHVYRYIAPDRGNDRACVWRIDRPPARAANSRIRKGEDLVMSIQILPEQVTVKKPCFLRTSSATSLGLRAMVTVTSDAVRTSAAMRR